MFLTSALSSSKGVYFWFSETKVTFDSSEPISSLFISGPCSLSIT